MLKEEVRPVHSYNPLVQIAGRFEPVGGDARMSEPQRNLTVDELEVVEGQEHHKVEGWVPELAMEARSSRGASKRRSIIAAT